MSDTSHLDALNLRLSHERERLRLARTESERRLREVWVRGIEKEIAAERQFLGLPEEADDLSLDEIMDALDDLLNAEKKP